MSTWAQQAPLPNSEDAVPPSQVLWLKVLRCWHGMPQMLGLKRLQEIVQGNAFTSDAPVWVLGVRFGMNEEEKGYVLDAESHKNLLDDFGSRLWVTYRNDFHPISGPMLDSDVGWGCTLRSGQMLMAEALLRHRMGRQWQRSKDETLERTVLDILHLFLDVPSDENPYSIHNICRHGAKSGIVPGNWLGPWVLCHALRSATKAAALAGTCKDIELHVLCDPGGGAPMLYADGIRNYFKAGLHGNGGSSPRDKSAEAAIEADGQELILQQNMAEACSTEGATQYDSDSTRKALVLLIPLTLGIDKINPRYCQQIEKVLTFSQSLGIVGGRPGSSLYFIGYQNDNLLYLDPHEVQRACPLSSSSSTYFCSSPKLISITAIDPSLALGFYCRTLDEVNDLLDRFSELIAISEGAPLLTISQHESSLKRREPMNSTNAEIVGGSNEIFSGVGEGHNADHEWEFL